MRFGKMYIMKVIHQSIMNILFKTVLWQSIGVKNESEIRKNSYSVQRGKFSRSNI